MLDIETLGHKPGSVIFEIGACVFDAKGIHQEFSTYIKPSSCEAAGLKCDSSTVAWWLKQKNPGVIEHAETMGDTIEAALAKLSEFIRGAAEIWANSPNFDICLLEAAYAACKMPRPWAYWNLQDLRTIRAWTKTKKSDQPKVHRALVDARQQVMDLLEIERRWLPPAAADHKIEASDVRLLESLPTP